MFSYGPYVLNPYASYGSISAASIPIPIVVGDNGLAEIINLSSYLIQIQFGKGGTLWQDPQSKVIYKLGQTFGQQLVTINVPSLMQTQFNPASPQLNFSQSTHNTPTDVGLVLNVYEKDEMEWYPPVALGTLVSQVTNFVTHSITSGAYTVQVPTTGTRYGFTNRPICYCTGFDISIDVAGTSTGGNLTITNILQQDSGDTQLNYLFRANTSFAQFFSIRFPQPVTNDPSTANQITFNVPALGGAWISLNVYYHF